MSEPMGNAVNTGAVETQAVQSPTTEVNAPVQNAVGEQTQTVTTPLKYEIDGIGEVTPDQIKEWKQGAMRQSDYTKKTQELAKQRSETKDALELYEYLKRNPQVANAIANGDYSAVHNNPAFQKLNNVDKRFEDLDYKFASIELDKEISRLKSIYPDFNEVEVITEADRLGMADLEFVYNGLQGKKMPTLKEQLTKEIRSKITEELKNNNDATTTIINTTDVSPQNSYGLSEAQRVIAHKMGLSDEQYANGLKRK